MTNTDDMIHSAIHDSLASLTATQLAKLLVMRYGIMEFGYTYTSTDDDGQDIPVTLDLLAAMPGEEIETLFDEESHDDAVNEVKYVAEEANSIPTWCHNSWTRHYDVDVAAFPMPDGRALAFCNVTGGGKHGDPNAYPWFDEAKFIMVAGVETVIIKKYAFELPPQEAVSEVV